MTELQTKNPKVSFTFDKEKDMYNIWETANVTSSWFDYKKTLHPSFLRICEGKKFEECKVDLENHGKRLYGSGMIEIFAKAIQEAWNNINDEFFKRLEKLMKKPVYIDEFRAYVTTISRCPYDEKSSWFMVSFFRDILSALKVAGHELMHLQFHHTYWSEVEKQIGYDKTADLKEALTVLLNVEFKDLWFVEDVGYLKHKNLREFIEKTWKEKKDFDILINECITFLKKDDL
jgi:hypothetical protein